MAPPDAGKSPDDGRRVVIVGSGFGGSILARVLHRILAPRGGRVTLVEKLRHPRFALGESTTPLANLALERIARRWQLPDLWQLAAYGRWRRHWPELRRGVKRGFTFYHHRPGEPFDGAAPGRRLLVAASPEEYVADSHWLRADVDHHLVRQARCEGVEVLEGCRLDTPTAPRGSGIPWSLTGVLDHGKPWSLTADFLVDATGIGGFLAGSLGESERPTEDLLTHSGLIAGHFAAVEPDLPLSSLPAGPYPDLQAAVHHVVEEGWVYQLPFDHGVHSLGLVWRGELPPAEPAELWRQTLERYPALRPLAQATPPDRLGRVERLQVRRNASAGSAWARLPHAYAVVDPLYSTGMAWTLLGVERLAGLFEQARSVPAATDLRRYDTLLRREATQIDRLVAGGYRAMTHPRLLSAQTMLYFATVSWAEIRQRLVPGVDGAWEGFLGVGDEIMDDWPAEGERRLRALGENPDDAALAEFETWARATIEPRNIAGLADPDRQDLYPADLEVLVRHASLLGLDEAEVRRGLGAMRLESRRSRPDP